MPNPPQHLESQLLSLRQAQKQGRHTEVLAQAQPLIESWPQNRDLLLLKAHSQRHLLHIHEALATLAQLESHHPNFSHLHQERGLCYVARKQAPQAIASLQRAVAINPALLQSWSMLAGLFRLINDPQNAAAAQQQIETLKALPAELLQSISLFSDGELAQAEKIIRAFLLRAGNHPEAMRILAKIGVANDVLDDAETLLAAVLQIQPDYHAARQDYTHTLIQRHKHKQAQQQAELLLAIEPANHDYRALMATSLVGLGEHQKAITIYQQMTAAQPQDPDAHLWLAHALKTVGRVPESIQSYHAAIAARPDFGDAYWSLANLKLYRFTDAEITSMRAHESNPATTQDDRIHLCFALGKAYEDRKEYEKSWHYYAQGNALKRATSRYRPEIFETNTRHQITICTHEFFAARTSWGNPAPDPIFIVGLPRAGSTLIEQILASHSQVEGTQELPDIQRIVLEMQGREPDLDNPRYPTALLNLSQQDIAQLGTRYLQETQPYRTNKPFFIDKMPNNYRHIGLIHLMLPNARIIDARRDPLSCCFSNFKQLFAQGQEFTYALEDIARYYRTYLDLMRHWDRVLPNRVLRVQHEDVVENLEHSVKRILDYCQLPFEQACIDFHKNTRAVRTPSSEQVRQPIFRDGIENWKNYQPWLDPLQTTLADAIQRYREPPQG